MQLGSLEKLMYHCFICFLPRSRLLLLFLQEWLFRQEKCGKQWGRRDGVVQKYRLWILMALDEIVDADNTATYYISGCHSRGWILGMNSRRSFFFLVFLSCFMFMLFGRCSNKAMNHEGTKKVCF